MRSQSALLSYIDMMQRTRSSLFLMAIFIVTLLWAARSGFADNTIRVFDHHRLMRAFSKVQGSAEVVLTIKAAGFDATPLSLSNVDGLAHEIIGRIDGATTVRFLDVPAGTWQLKGLPKSAQVERVEISTR